MTRPTGSELPSSSTSFVGREGDVDAVLEALTRRGRLVSLIGYGGVGKTRLAVETSHIVSSRFADEVLFIDLYSQGSPGAAAEKIVAALRLPGAADRSPLEDITSFFTDRDCLLVLDNCEQDIEELPEIIRQILDNGPQTRLLVTSRTPLGMTSEIVLNIGPLSLPPDDDVPTEDSLEQYSATRLFLERARARASSFALDPEECVAVAALCRRLDGIPLSIELAAARAGTMSAERIVSHLNSPALFELLARGDASAPERHRGLQQVIAWSWEQCSTAEKQVWNALSVFASPPTWDAVRSVVDPSLSDAELDFSLDGLAMKAVVAVERVGTVIRFHLPVTTAEFAATTREAAITDELRERHRRHFVRAASRIAAQFWRGEQRRAVRQVRREMRDLAAAWERSISSDDTVREAADMVITLRIFWTMGGAMATGRRWLDETLHAWTANDETRADLLWTAAWVDAVSGDLQRASAHLVECERLTADLPGGRARAWLATWSGTVALFSGRLHDAKAHFLDALRRHADRDDAEGILMTQFQAALVCGVDGDMATARCMCERSLEIADAVGDDWGRSYAIWTEVLLEMNGGHTTRARTLVVDALQRKYDLQDRLGLALVGEAAVALMDDDARAPVVRGIIDRCWSDAGTNLAAFGPLVASASRARARNGQADTADERRGRSMPAEEALRFLRDSLTNHAASSVSADLPKFTVRESEVARLLEQGHSNREMAEKLTVSTRTIEGHVESVLRKLGVHSRVHAALALASRSSDSGSPYP